MRVPWHLDAQCIDRCVRAAEQGAQVRAAKGEVDGLLRPSDDADERAVRVDDPDAARTGAINPADAVDFEPVRDAGLRTLVKIGEDAARPCGPPRRA